MAQPVQLAKSSRFIILASICIVVAALYFAQVVLIPLAVAVLLCFLLAPLVTRIERWGLGRVPAVLIVVLLSLGAVVGIGWITTVQVVNLAGRVDEYKVEIVDKVHRFKQYFASSRGGTADKLKNAMDEVQRATTQPAAQPASQPTTTVATDGADGAEVVTAPPDIPSPLDQAARDPLDAAAREVAGAPPAQAPPVGTTRTNPLWVTSIPEPQSPLATLGAYVAPVVEPLGTAGLVLVFVIFMLLQREDLRDRIIRLVGKGQIHVTTTALDDAATRISRYLMAQALVNGTYGIAISLGLWAIGYFIGDKPFPSFVLWGLLCALLRFIPYIGPWIAAVFPLALSLAVFHGFGAFFATVVLFVAIELVSNNFMEPWLYGTSTGMSTVAILVSAVFWTWLWGAIGLLLATPLTVCLVVLGKYVPQLQFLDILLGDEPVLDPPARVYQRLLALDQEEAAELAHEHLNKTSLERTYDEVLLPALAMAEQDRHKGKIDEEREGFITQAMRDMVDELGDAARAIEERRASEDMKEAAAANVAVAKGFVPTASSPAPAASNGGGNGNGKASAASALTPVSPAARVGGDLAPLPAGGRPLLPKGCTVNVVCLPARDDGDDIANQMLAQLLSFRGYCTFAVPVAALASEMLDAVAERKAHVVVVSALPPGAVSYSRYLCKRLHARYENTIPMAVGLWTIRGDLKKAKERITCAADVQIATTLTGMIDLVHQMAQPVIVKQENDAAAGAPPPPPATRDERVSNAK